MSEREKPVFRIGLCLAGAISAGAYTAGVLDYLVEALDQWEQKKKVLPPEQVPSHKVEIPIIGGASAGGMTGMILGTALHQRFDPIRQIPNGKNPIEATYPQNPLYHAWVDQLEAENPKVFPGMLDYLLDCSDVTKPGNIQSLLNSSFIEKIANKVIKVPCANQSVNRSYIPERLKVFVTVTNLMGMEFPIAFNTGKSNYLVQDHRDYGCFCFSSGEIHPHGGWEWVDFLNQGMLERYKSTAIATGAFPVALSPVKLSRPASYLSELNWLKHLWKDKSDTSLQNYDSVMVDGGMCNNEPFEKIREELNALTGISDESKNQNYSDFESTVLMIDPFPSVSSIGKAGDNLFGYLGNLLSALVSQSRIKSEHLCDSLESDKAGQFEISPIRYSYGTEGENKVFGAQAIACGSLDGFGGFFSKEFRMHDFFLGRANCEKFLRDHFTVRKDAHNPIFDQGYGNLNEQSRKRFTSDADGGYQIIPLFTQAKEKPFFPTWKNSGTWPKVNWEEVGIYQSKVKKRVHGLVLNSADLSKKDHILLWLGSKAFITPKISKLVMDTIESSLKKHRQLIGR